jgi:hypothetical protein
MNKTVAILDKKQYYLASQWTLVRSRFSKKRVEVFDVGV